MLLTNRSDFTLNVYTYNSLKMGPIYTFSKNIIIIYVFMYILYYN